MPSQSSSALLHSHFHAYFGLLCQIALNFYEDFLNWIEQENAQGNLPILEGNKEAVELKVSTTGYAFQTDENSARYQIQLKLIYLQKGGV